MMLCASLLVAGQSAFACGGDLDEFHNACNFGPITAPTRLSTTKGRCRSPGEHSTKNIAASR
jgi:hypothetical protein